MLSRRSLIYAAGSSGLLLVAAPALVGLSSANARMRWPKGDPFSLGVAAGDPRPDGFVLWTRLAPEPLSDDPALPGGMAPGDVQIDFEVGRDPALQDIVRRGQATAESVFGHSVHLELKGLEPGRSYWYRFRAGDAESPIGRAITAPAPGSSVQNFRFAFASCSHYEQGYFSAYRHMADEHPDLVVFLGDYIYEYSDQSRKGVRVHHGCGDAVDLAGYRNRYAEYRMDPDLKRLHQEVPTIATWDDHEVQNDYADRWSETFDDPEWFLERRASAYQAFYEHMPVRPSLSRPKGHMMRIYERYGFGDLIEFSVLDGRQYRSREACYAPPNKGGGHLEFADTCAELTDPTRSLLGMPQEAWLYNNFAESRTRWNVIAQDMMMAELIERAPDGRAGAWTEDWNGYPAARTRLLEQIRETKLSNPVVISGDMHAYWTSDLALEGQTLAAEFVGTSITSGSVPRDVFAKFLPDNPHVRYMETDWRGCVSMDVSRDQITARLQTISDVRDAQATKATLKTFVVENGKPGAQDA